jgi:hypothetical protein
MGVDSFSVALCVLLLCFAKSFCEVKAAIPLRRSSAHDLIGDKAARQRELQEAHRLFTEIGVADPRQPRNSVWQQPLEVRQDLHSGLE